VSDEILRQATMAMCKAGCSSEEIEKALVRYAEVMRVMTADNRANHEVSPEALPSMEPDRWLGRGDLVANQGDL